MQQRVSRVVTAVLWIALAAFAWRGWYTRYMRDDYCTAAAVKQQGLWKAMTSVRQTWSGRYSYYAVKGVLELAGPWTARVVPALLIIAFVLAASRLVPSHRWLVATTIVFATLDATPNLLDLGGPLAWETGAITYLLPLVLLTAWIALLRARPSWIAGVALMLVAGGLSETSLAAQGAITFGASIVTWRDRPRRLFALSGLAATILALALTISAPGNRERMETAPPRTALHEAVVEAGAIAVSFVATTHPAALLVVMVVASIAGTALPRPRPALLAGFVATLAFFASFLPATWMLSMAPPDRALIVCAFCLVLMLGCLVAAYVSWRKHVDTRVDYAVLAIVCVIPVYAAIQTVRDIAPARRVAAEEDRIVAILKEGQGHDVVVQSPWAARTAFASEVPEFWVNRCLCAYYGVRTLQVRR